MTETQLFHYKCTNTVLHKIPSGIKIIIMLLLAGLAFYMPLKEGFLIWALIIIFEFFLLKFSAKEIAVDLKPSITYFIMLYSAAVIINIIAFINEKRLLAVHEILKVLTPDTVYLSLFMHLGLSMQITSVFFRTTSTMQLNEGLSIIEKTITRKTYTPLSDMLSLTITFIPRLSSFWNQIETAWKARGGKEKIGKITTLSPILFRVSMHEAYLKALARQNRTEYNFSTNSEVYKCDAPHVENLMIK